VLLLGAGDRQGAGAGGRRYLMLLLRSWWPATGEVLALATGEVLGPTSRSSCRVGEQVLVEGRRLPARSCRGSGRRARPGAAGGVPALIAARSRAGADRAGGAD
jgi:hypothetical protein